MNVVDFTCPELCRDWRPVPGTSDWYEVVVINGQVSPGAGEGFKPRPRRQLGSDTRPCRSTQVSPKPHQSNSDKRVEHQSMFNQKDVVRQSINDFLCFSFFFFKPTRKARGRTIVAALRPQRGFYSYTGDMVYLSTERLKPNTVYRHMTFVQSLLWVCQFGL